MPSLSSSSDTNVNDNNTQDDAEIAFLLQQEEEMLVRSDTDKGVQISNPNLNGISNLNSISLPHVSASSSFDYFRDAFDSLRPRKNRDTTTTTTTTTNINMNTDPYHNPNPNFEESSNFPLHQIDPRFSLPPSHGQGQGQAQAQAQAQGNPGVNLTPNMNNNSSVIEGRVPKICTKCNHGIRSGKAIFFLNGLLHKECFVCYLCGEQIEANEATVLDCGDGYQQPCHKTCKKEQQKHFRAQELVREQEKEEQLIKDQLYAESLQKEEEKNAGKGEGQRYNHSSNNNKNRNNHMFPSISIPSNNEFTPSSATIGASSIISSKESSHSKRIRAILSASYLVSSTQSQLIKKKKNNNPFSFLGNMNRDNSNTICTICNEKFPSQNGRYYFKRNAYFEDEIYCPHHQDGDEDSDADLKNTNNITTTRNGKIHKCWACLRKEPIWDSRLQFQSMSDKDTDLRVCYECAPTVIVDTEDIQQCYREILNFFVEEFGLDIEFQATIEERVSSPLSSNSKYDDNSVSSTVINRTAEYIRMKDIPVLSVGSEELGEGHSTGSRMLGLTLTQNQSRTTSHYSLNLMQQKRPLYEVVISEHDVSAILILRGLPRVLTNSILAHETFHAWLQLRHGSWRKRLSSMVEEGMCQLIGYLYLMRMRLSRNKKNNNNNQEEGTDRPVEENSPKTRSYLSKPRSKDRSEGELKQFNGKLERERRKFQQVFSIN